MVTQEVSQVSTLKNKSFGGSNFSNTSAKIGTISSVFLY